LHTVRLQGSLQGEREHVISMDFEQFEEEFQDFRPVLSENKMTFQSKQHSSAVNNTRFRFRFPIARCVDKPERQAIL